MKHLYVLLLIVVSLPARFTAQPTQFSLGQEIKLTHAFADSVRRVKSDTGAKLRAIAEYNKAVKSFGYTDTIDVHASGDQFTYFYKRLLPQDFTYSDVNPKRPFMISYSGKEKLTYMVAAMEQSPSTRFEIAAKQSPGNPEALIYSLTHYENDVKIGRYEEQSQTGITLLRGQYCQRDTSFLDTVTYFDPKTYEESVVIHHWTTHAVKTGRWFYFSPEGILTREETYPGCK